MNSSAHITPAFCCLGTLPAIWSSMGSPRWYSSKQIPCFAPNHARGNGGEDSPAAWLPYIGLLPVKIGPQRLCGSCKRP